MKTNIMKYYFKAHIYEGALLRTKKITEEELKIIDQDPRPVQYFKGVKQLVYFNYPERIEIKRKSGKTTYNSLKDLVYVTSEKEPIEDGMYAVIYESLEDSTLACTVDVDDSIEEPTLKTTPRHWIDEVMIPETANCLSSYELEGVPFTPDRGMQNSPTFIFAVITIKDGKFDKRLRYYLSLTKGNITTPVDYFFEEEDKPLLK